MPVLEADITSQWFNADQSQNCAQVAQTEVPGLFAVRSSYDKTRVIRLTSAQIEELADRVRDQDSDLNKMIENGHRHERNGSRNGYQDRDRREVSAR